MKEVIDHGFYVYYYYPLLSRHKICFTVYRIHLTLKSYNCWLWQEKKQGLVAK